MFQPKKKQKNTPPPPGDQKNLKPPPPPRSVTDSRLLAEIRRYKQAVAPHPQHRSRRAAISMHNQVFTHHARRCLVCHVTPRQS